MPSKGTTNQRGYGRTHRHLRAQYVPLVKSGNAICWRCGTPIAPNAKWDLGHDDEDRTKWKGPEHIGRECPAGGNRATKARGAKPNPGDGPATDTSRRW